MTEQEKCVLNQIREDEVVEFISNLIRAKSTYPPDDSREAAQVCADKLREAGLDVKIVNPDPSVHSIWNDGVDNNIVASVIATYPGAKARPVLAFNAHIDTVAVGDRDKWIHDPFSGLVEDGYVYGRGAGDDKGSVCAQVMAAVALARAGIKLEGTLMLTPVGDEEAGSHRGSQWLRDSGQLDPDYLIIGEQTNNEVAIAERATVWIDVTIKGRACHGAMPWKGDNAVVRAAHFVNKVENEYYPELKKRVHPYLPHATVSVNRIRGGINYNAVPAECQVTLDRRMVPGENRQMVEKEIHELLKQQMKETSPFEYDLVVAYDAGLPVNTDADNPMVKTMLTIVEEVTGKKTAPIGYQQGGDGRLFASKGIPIVTYGPTDPEVGHSPNEKVAIAQLVEASKIYALAAMRILKVQE